MLDAAELEEYWAFLERNLDLAAIRAAKLTLLADFCNGAEPLTQSVSRRCSA